MSSAVATLKTRGIDMNPTRTAEIALNLKLAELLRQQHIPAAGERLHERLQYDCLVVRDDDIVSIEAEFAPAGNVKAEAAGRIGKRLEGKAVGLVVALVYPSRLRNAADKDIGDELGKCADLKFSFGEIDENKMNPPLLFDGKKSDARPIRWGAEETGSVDTLANHLWSRWTENRSIGEKFDELVAQLDTSVQQAADVIYRNRAARQNIIKALGLDMLGIDEGASLRAASLILCNALLFHELLSRIPGLPSTPVSNDMDRDRAAEDWQAILDINWYPVFGPALEALRYMNSNTAAESLTLLRPAAKKLAWSNIPARHDLSGRVFHRLLIGGKYLSPNYTTITAAIILSTLALEGVDIDWGDTGQIKKLDITDPACGTGTLLVAAAEEIRRRHFRASLDAGKTPAESLGRDILQHTLRGRDVVLAAVHLTAATLAMMETSQKINRTQLAQMPLTVDRSNKDAPIPYLGSLDYLSTSQTKPRPINLPDAPKSVTGGGEQCVVDELESVDVAILNPPFFKSQGATVAKDGKKEWKAFFGLMTRPEDAAAMRRELQRRLSKLPASMKAGGSAFICLADEALSNDGTLACVLPSVVWTGSSWLGIRQMWTKRYNIDWVVVSHDNRYRPKWGETPGRYHVSMSESTSLAETLIVARRRASNVANRPTKIVNLASNPTHPIDANNLVRQLIKLDESSIPDISDTPGAVCSIRSSTNGKSWGEVIKVTLPNHQNCRIPDIGRLISGATAFCNSELAQTAWHLVQGNLYLPGKTPVNIPTCTVGKIGDAGPSGIQIKGRAAPGDMMPVGKSGYPAIWHHDADSITKIEAKPNASIVAKKGREKEVNRLWRLAGRVHIAKEFRLNTQRAAAVWSPKKMLGVRSWNTLKIHFQEPAAAREKALILWLNSTLGILLSITHANRPYPGRIDTPLAGLRELPVLDVRTLSAVACEEANLLWKEVSQSALLPFSRANDDSTRQKIDRLFAKKILKLPDNAIDEIAGLRKRMGAESIVRGTRKATPTAR